jgi:hypothetical protein
LIGIEQDEDAGFVWPKIQNDKHCGEGRNDMLRKWTIILSLGVMFLVAAPVQAQIAVVEVNAAQQSYWLKQLLHMITIINDGIRQGRLRDGIWNERTGDLLNEIAAYSTGDELLYGQDGSAIWREVYTYDYVPDDGTLQELELGRDWHALNTQQTLLHQLEMLRAEDEEDEERISSLQARVDGAIGRNMIEQANAAVQAEALHQERKTRQAVTTLANAMVVANGYHVNKNAAERAAERAFLTNFNKPVPFPAFAETGL